LSRPQADINWELVAEYLEAGCTGTEIAAMLGISAPTLYDRCQTDNGMMFSEFSQEKKQKGDLILKKVQFEAAIKDKDRTMLVWLGKQRLGQKEKAEQDIKVDGGINIIFKPAYEGS
jgi:transposase-like protein